MQSGSLNYEKTKAPCSGNVATVFSRRDVAHKENSHMMDGVLACKSTVPTGAGTMEDCMH